MLAEVADLSMYNWALVCDNVVLCISCKECSCASDGRVDMTLLVRKQRSQGLCNLASRDMRPAAARLTGLVAALQGPAAAKQASTLTSSGMKLCFQNCWRLSSKVDCSGNEVPCQSTSFSCAQGLVSALEDAETQQLQ